MAKILVGLSGGVDSAVTAALLKRQGHEVLGYTLKLLEQESTNNSDGGCCSFKDIRDARMVCDKMGIEYLVTNWRDTFKKNVIDRYVEGAKDGITHNPCVTCNSTIKLPVLVAVANHFGCDYVATGHYARVSPDGQRVVRARNAAKDQSYFLWETPTHLLSRIMFPLGEFESKDDTRALAREFGLHVAEKRDSTDLCFLGGGTKQEFLARSGVQSSPGSFLSPDGASLATHTGYTKYVPGQRAPLGGPGGPKYVLRVIPSSGGVVVGTREQGLTTIVALRDTRMPQEGDLSGMVAVLRYHSTPVTVKALRGLGGDGLASLELADPVFGVSPGQSCVFYKNDEIAGGGVVA